VFKRVSALFDFWGNIVSDRYKPLEPKKSGVQNEAKKPVKIRINNISHQY